MNDGSGHEELTDDAMTEVLFGMVMEGYFNVKWDESSDPPVPMFSLTDKGEATALHTIKRLAHLANEDEEGDEND